jgi:hypothetical protein
MRDVDGLESEDLPVEDGRRPCPKAGEDVHFFPGTSKRCCCGLTNEQLSTRFVAREVTLKHAREMGWM